MNSWQTTQLFSLQKWKPFLCEKRKTERAQQQRCGKKRNPQKSQGTPIKKVTCSTKKIPIIIWYDILRLRSARWILIGSYVDIEILEVSFFLSIETSLQIKWNSICIPFHNSVSVLQFFESNPKDFILNNNCTFQQKCSRVS